LGPIWTQNQNYDLFEKTWWKLGPKRYFNLLFICYDVVHMKCFSSFRVAYLLRWQHCLFGFLQMVNTWWLLSLKILCTFIAQRQATKNDKRLISLGKFMGFVWVCILEISFQLTQHIVLVYHVKEENKNTKFFKSFLIQLITWMKYIPFVEFLFLLLDNK